MCLAIIVALFAANVSRAAYFSDCTSRLLERYGTESSEALHGFATSLRTLRPEAGSIADRDPSVLSEIARIVRSFEAGPSIERLVAIEWELDHILRTHDDPRLEALVRVQRRAVVKMREAFELAPAEFMAPSQEWHRLKSHAFELMVATMIAGEAIHLGPYVTDLHPELLGRWGMREIDIIAVAADGSERWIEVKNWQRFADFTHHLAPSLLKQAEATERLQEDLGDGARVRRELVMRNGVSPTFFWKMMERTGYYRISFIYLDRADDLTAEGWE